VNRTLHRNAPQTLLKTHFVMNNQTTVNLRRVDACLRRNAIADTMDRKVAWHLNWPAALARYALCALQFV